MRDLSLHLLDLAQNSITAGASLVSIRITVDENGWLTLVLADDGKGMSPELLARVTSPFATTRTTRKVGLGIPMMMENAEKAGGSLRLKSEVGVGTEMTVTMDTRNIDCLPLGDLCGTVLSLIMTNPLSPDFLVEGKTVKGECRFDTREVRAALGHDIPLNEPEVAAWLQEALKEEMEPIFGGV
ncbi:MAG: sensor histidine kinase [Clostridia bacterium]|nr:sensor histidine kinase [Clostridia bacterium]